MTDKNQEELEGSEKKRFPVIWLIIIIFITFLGALIAGFFIDRFLNKQQISLSILTLIVSVIIVALFMLSIILAVINIWLIKNTESKVFKKSEEGVMLQKEIIDYNSEMLREIRSLVERMKKAFDTFVSAQKARAEQEPVSKPSPEPEPIVTKETVYVTKEETLESPKPEQIVTKETEEKAKEEKVESPKPEPLTVVPAPPPKPEPRWEEMEEMQKKGAAIEKDWKKFRSSIINMLKRRANVKLIQENEGDVNAEDQTFWNAIFKIKNKRVSLDIHTKGQIWTAKGLLQWLGSSEIRNNFVRKLGWRALQDSIDMVFVTFDKEVWSEPGVVEVANLIEDFNMRSKASKIFRLNGRPKDIVKEIISIINGKLTN